MILSANYRAFLLALLSYPLLGKVLSSYGSEPQRIVLFAQNWGQIFRRSVEVRTFVRIQKVIWDHLLASKKESPFSFGIMCILCTPRPTYRPTVDRCIGRHIGILHCYLRIGDCRHHLTCRLVTSAAQISLIYFPLLRGFFVYNPACLSSVPYHHLVILHRPYPLSCQLYFVYLAVFHLSVLLDYDNDLICGTWRPNVKPSEIFKVDQKGWNAHNLYTNSLSFWPIYHQQSTDIPPTINGQHIGQVSATISTEISADSWSICRPSLGRYLGWYISRYVDRHLADMSTDISADTRPICRPIGRSSVGCTKYTWSKIHSR